MPNTLLATKFFIPSKRPKLVPRPRLIEKLNNGLHRKVSLISAPAGFGKTTVVSEWIAQANDRVAWLSLDENDNDPIRFLQYVLGAFQHADRENTPFEADLMDLIPSDEPKAITSILTSFINSIVQSEENWLFILDDYHLIENQAVHEAMIFLLENSPPQLHLVIVTREDPFMPLARLRARDHLTELRAADLRFTNPEAAGFLNHVMGLNLTSDDIAALEERTEGWIVGLQLAAISLKESDNISAQIHSFTGSNRHVMDYLLEDVLTRQPEETQWFLLQTSILERFNSSLCDYVTGEENSMRILERLDQANLFIIPLDSGRNWYRYHHLFAGLLEQRLRYEKPNFVGKLHSRAAEWFEQQGLLSEAIQHSIAGDDFQNAVRLIEKGSERALERSDFGFIFANVSRLPEEITRNSPWLTMYHIWALVLTGKLDQAEALFVSIGQLRENLSKDDDPKLFLGHIAGAKSLYCSWRWDDQQMFELSKQAFNLLPPDHWVLGYCAMSMGAAYWGTGELEKAILDFSHANEIGKKSGHIRVIVTSIMYLVHSLEQQGRLKQALNRCQEAFSITQRGGQEMRLAGYLHIDIARIYYQLNELENASAHLEEGIRFCRQLADNRVEKLGQYLLARIELALGKMERAEQTLKEAEQTHHGKEPFVDMRGLEYPQVWLWLAQGSFRDIEVWVEETDVDLDLVTFFKGKLIYTMRARGMIALAQKNNKQLYLSNANRLLEKLYSLIEQREWIYKEIEVLILQALCYQLLGERDLALETLGKSLRLAEPEGFIRIFIDEGKPVKELLKLYKSKKEKHKEYIARLFSAFGDTEAKEQPLIDPLSSREIEVLELIAKGLTNQEIGNHLFLSLNTIKVHTRNIFSKLDVNNRTQAVAQGRELGLLSSD